VKRASKTGQWLFAIFAMGVAALNYPLLSLFAVPAHVAGVPLLYVYVFGGWALLIAIMALVVERPPD
jgi:hypothetical protein